MEEPSDTYESLIADLYYLRKSEGFTARRLVNAPALIRVLGGQQVFEHARSRFISAIESLPEASSRELLQAAYALSPDYATIVSLKERREKYGETVNRKYDTLANRENAAITELATRLLFATYTNAPLAATTPLPHGNYLLESLQVETLMMDKKFVSHIQYRRIVALASGLRSFAYHVDEQTDLIPLENCTIETERLETGSIHMIVFSKPLRRGQTYEFAFVEKRSKSAGEYEAPAIDWAGQVFQTPTLTYVQRVKFKGDQPAIIWTYHQMTNVQRPGEPMRDNLVKTNKQGVAEAKFTQLYGGFYTGVAWRW